MFKMNLFTSVNKKCTIACQCSIIYFVKTILACASSTTKQTKKDNNMIKRDAMGRFVSTKKTAKKAVAKKTTTKKTDKKAVKTSAKKTAVKKSVKRKA